MYATYLSEKIGYWCALNARMHRASAAACSRCDYSSAAAPSSRLLTTNAADTFRRRYISIYRHLQQNPDKQLYPLFAYFENWCDPPA